MTTICQINYNPVHTRMFARLAQLMLREDLCLGPPVFHRDTGKISQLQGMSPACGGGTNIFTHLGKDQWRCTYDDGDDTTILGGNWIHKWFSGEYQRLFTTSEEADICCHPSVANGWAVCEEDYVINENQDKLHAIGDNLYQITRAATGELIEFDNLAGAMAAL